MTWERAPAAAALAAVLTQLDDTVAVFASPPATLNAPAYVVGYTTRVDYGTPSFSIDLATQPVAACVGLGEVDRGDTMLAAAKAAIGADPSLGGAVQVARVTSQTNWRALNVAGADLLFGDLQLKSACEKGNGDMSETGTGNGGSGRGHHPQATLTAAGDPTPPVATPVMMTDAYVQVGTANLQCLAEEVSIEPENKPIEVTTFCGIQDYPGPVKWHFKAKFVQSFDVGATDDTLYAALTAYAADGTPVDIKVRPYGSRVIDTTNPSFEGTVVPQPYTLFGGTAGAASEVDVDWIFTAPPSKVTTPIP